MLTLTDYNLIDLTKVLAPYCLPSFKVKQIYASLCKGAQFEEMTDLAKPLRLLLAESFHAQGAVIEKVFTSPDGTEKFLFALTDGNIVEGVLMHYSYGNTLCISTQVGCRMGCAFCASTLQGLIRNCTVGEMFSFVALANRYASLQKPTQANNKQGNALSDNLPIQPIADAPCVQANDEYVDSAANSKPQRRRGVTNVVLMGSGEPLDNYDAVLAFLRRINEEQGINISLRNVSLSTCGLIDKIKRFAEEKTGVNLTISLHSPTQQGRELLLPVAKSNPLPQLMDAARYYFTLTSRRVIFEYTLCKGINDSEADAIALAKLVKGFPTHVNLIRLNPVSERNLTATAEKQAKAFLNKLTSLGVSATLRRSLGGSVSGACGQLRRTYLEALASSPPKQ